MWLGHIYYALGLIPLLMALAVLIKLKDYNKTKEWYSKFEKVTGKKPLKSEFRSVDEYNIYTGVSGITMMDLTWVILGLLTQSWYVFISIIVLSVIVNLIKKSVGLNVISNVLTGFLLITKFSVYLFLIINHFHLHYDVWDILKNNI
jgi:hypothetical protein